MKIFLNGEPREIVAKLTLMDLLQELKLESRNVAIELNLEVVPRQRHQEVTLQDGDRLEIVTLVGGG